MKLEDNALEKIFKISERLDGKSIVLNGFNQDTQFAMSFLANRGISIYAFLLTNDKDNDIDNNLLIGEYEYLTKPLIARESLYDIKLDNVVLLDVFPDKFNEIEEYGIDKDVLFKPLVKKLYIYGAGECGRKFYDLSTRCGINIESFIDESPKEKSYLGCQIKGLDALDTIAKDSMIVIAIDSRQKNDKVNCMLKEYDFSNCYYYRLNDIFDIFVCADDGINGVMDTPKLVCKPRDLRYIYKCALKKPQKLYIYSNNVEFIKQIIHIWHTIGIHGVYGCCENTSTFEFEGTSIINFYELIYMPKDSVAICLLPGEEKNTKCLLNKLGLSNISLINIFNAPVLFSRDEIPDVNLGYADNRGICVVRNCEPCDNPYRLGILGGSTSDYDLYFEKSWVYYLLKKANTQNIKMEVYDGATAGYTSSQECIRLVRDLLPKKLDAVVCYSGINDVGGIQTVKDYVSVHKYQENLFNSFCHGKNNFSMGEKHEDCVEEWITNQRIMHTVCVEFGIKHMTFLQPYLHYKYNGGNEKFELINFYWNRKQSTYDLWKKVVNDIESISNRIEGKYDWLVDLTSIFENTQELVYFDSAHLTEHGNMIVADTIFDYLLKEGIF